MPVYILLVCVDKREFHVIVKELKVIFRIWYAALKNCDLLNKHDEHIQHQSRERSVTFYIFSTFGFGGLLKI